MHETICFIGFGEAGQAIARGLRGEGVHRMRAYDLLFDGAGSLRPKTGELGVKIARDHADAVRGATLIFLAVTAKSSLEAAQSCLPGLEAGQLFVDINSVAPQKKRDTAALVAPSGALYVDAAVMAPVAPSLHKVPILASGAAAREFASRAGALGMKVEAFGEEVGAASAVKMFRSIMVKGIEALMVESMLASSEYGVERRVLASLQESFPGLDWERLSGYMLERVLSHGQRRADEMREVAATLEAMELEPVMAAATARRQQWLADLMVKHPRTEDRAALLAAIREALGASARKKVA